MYATALRCFRCGAEHPFEPAAYLCPRCGPGAPKDSTMPWFT